EPTAPRWTRAELGGLAGLLLFAFLVRLAGNDQWPIGVSYDEASNGVEAIGLMENPTFPIWSGNLSGRPTLHLHVLALTFKLLEPTPETLRGVSALVGILGMVPLYLAGRWLGGRPLAFAAAGFLAVSRWDLTYSRIAYEAIFGPLCAGVAIY